MTMNCKNQEGELESWTTQEALKQYVKYVVTGRLLVLNIPFYDIHSRIILYKNAKLKYRITLYILYYIYYNAVNNIS